MKTIYKGSNSLVIHSIDLEGWLSEGWGLTPPSEPVSEPKKEPLLKRRRKAKSVVNNKDK